MAVDGDVDGGMRSAGDVIHVMAGRRSLEVWRTLDGRVLLHQPGPGQHQAWIEVLPEAIGWLMERLSEFRIGITPIPCETDCLDEVD